MLVVLVSNCKVCYIPPHPQIRKWNWLSGAEGQIFQRPSFPYAVAKDDAFFQCVLGYSFYMLLLKQGNCCFSLLQLKQNFFSKMKTIISYV